MTSGNPTLDKNLDAIARYNNKLAQDLLNLPYLTSSIKLIETNLKEPNLAYNGLILHAQDGAELEAKNTFSKAINNPLSRHIIFGIGIGHLFKEFCERSKGIVFLFEPNLEILRVTLELVDFSKELSQENVFVVSDIQSFKQIYTNNYTYQATATISFLGSYKQIYGEEMDTILRQMEQINGSCMVEYNTLKMDGVRSIHMVLDNLSYTLNETPLVEFKDIYKGKTALIISAGPSLDANIDIIKNNRDKVIIFCVGTAFKSLASNNITPDFVNIMEINDCSSQVKGFDLSNINFIMEPYTNTSIHKLNVKKKFLFVTNSAHANNYWARLTNVDISPYTAKGTVSYESLLAAKMLGFKKIILVGQDLAYLDNKCYSDNAAYSQLAFEVNPQTGRPEFKIKDLDAYIKSMVPIGTDVIDPWHKEFAKYKIDNLNKTLCFVKGISGEMLPTQSGYATFIEHFREFAFLNKDLELINTSMVGAQLDGFKNIPLDKALENESTIERIELSKPFKYNQNNILENLEKEKKELKDILEKFAKAKEYIFKYDREFHRRKTVTPEANKMFKNLLNIYNTISHEYYAVNPLYQILAFNENIELEYLIKMTEKVDMEKIKQAYILLKRYFEQIEPKISYTIKNIDEQKVNISESINSKSKKSECFC